MAGDPAPPSKLAAQLEAIIAAKIASDKLVLPSMPAVAAKCLALLRNPAFSFKEASHLVEMDPAMTVQLLRLGNSAAFVARDPAKTVLQVVTRVGVDRLRGFLVESSARKVFQSTDPRIAQANAAVWDHSIAVAVLARDVMAFSTGGDPEYGYMGGLLHDIGKPVVASMLLDAERAVLAARAHAQWITSDEWIGVIRGSHRKVGLALSEKWDLPDPVKRCLKDCEEYDNTDRLSAANVVRFANALAKKCGFQLGPVDQEDNDALVMIGRSLLNLDDELVNRLAANLARAVKEQLT
jgi:putative nucleotidyltransferase with HDIG domain